MGVWMEGQNMAVVEVIKSNHSTVLISIYSSLPIEDTRFSPGSYCENSQERNRKLIYVLTLSFGGDVQGFDDSDVIQGCSSESLVASRCRIKFSASKELGHPLPSDVHV
jgi:hypothetical protein